MGDVRFDAHLQRIRDAADPARLIREMSDDEVVQALAAASRTRDPLLSNVLATEAMNRLHRATTVTDTIAEGAYAIDAEGRITLANPAALRLLGWRRSETLGVVAFDVLELEHPDGRPVLREEWPPWPAMGDGRTLEGEVRLRRKDGSSFPALYSWSPIRREGEVEGAVVTFRDITERKRDADELAFQKLLLEAQNDAYGDGVLLLDPEGGFASFNRRFVELWRIPGAIATVDHEEEILAHALTLVEDEEGFFDAPRRLLAVAREAIWDELRLKDGRVFERYGAKLRDPHGAHRGQVWVFRDITDRVAAERERALLASIVEGSDDAIVSKDLDGVITSWNKAAERIFGYTASEAVGRSILMLVPPDLPDEERSILARIRAGERIQHHETRRVRKDGRIVHVSVTISPIRDRTGRVVGASKIAREIPPR